MRLDKKGIALIIIYSIIILSSAYCAVRGIFFGAGAGQVGDSMVGIGYLKAFTSDSNILCGIVSAMSLAYLLKNRTCDYAGWLRGLNLMATTAVCVTFVLVVLFLNPVMSLQRGDMFVMFENDMFHFHFLNPVLAVTAIILCRSEKRYTRAMWWCAAIPVFVYSIVYLINVVFLKTWNDFYGFTFGGKMFMVPVVMAAIYGLSMGLTSILARIGRTQQN